MNTDHPIFVIQRTGKRTQLSKRTMHEQEVVNSRMKKAGGNFQLISNQLNSIYGKILSFNDLMFIADSATKKTQIKIDRISKRSKSALICWFCEHWENIKNILSDIPIANQSEIKYSSNEEELSQDQIFIVPTKDPKKFNFTPSFPLYIF